jgi:hypothetical protein
VLGIPAAPTTPTALTLLGVPTLPGIIVVGIAPPRLGSALAVSWGEHDLKFDQFIPLRIRALPLWYR